jgi:putative transposase
VTIRPRGRFGSLCGASVSGVPRILRTTLPDGYFHITARGVEQRSIYLDAEDCRWFLALFGSTARRFSWELYAFCLMTNHYHVVLEATREALSNGVQRLNGVYAHDFNDRHGRWGHLFGGRFRSWAIESEEHLYAACKYVLQNPVRAGLCERAEDWPWSGSRWGKRLAE